MSNKIQVNKLSPKITYKNTGKKHWVLEEDVKIVVYNQKITIPKGYTTDLASVPWLLRFLFPVVDIDYLAAIVHDYLCEYGADYNIPRWAGDNVFYTVHCLVLYDHWLKNKKVPFSKRWRGFFMFMGIKLFWYWERKLSWLI